MYFTFKIKEKEFGFDTKIITRILIIILAVFLVFNIRLVGACFTNTSRFIFGSAKRYEKNLEEFNKGVEACNKTIILDNVKSGTELQRLAHEVLEGTPEFFHIASMGSVKLGKTSYEIRLTYRYSGQAYENAKIDFNNRLDAICANIDMNWSDLEKANYIHDYIANNYKYDYNKSDTIHDAYRMLLNGKGVCSAYSNLYKALCNKVEVDCEVVWTKANNHAWNVIKINGFWYNVDVTWDDTGEGSKEYYLVPDNTIWGDGHSQWINCGKYKITCFRYNLSFKKK